MTDPGQPTQPVSRQRFSDEYVELCRKLALPRTFRQGDWYSWIANDATHMVNLWPSGPAGRTPEAFGFVWLPTEGDWLDLLEAEGVISIEIAHNLATDPPSRFTIEALQRQRGRLVSETEGDRLTALCRLYMAVKGIEP